MVICKSIRYGNYKLAAKVTKGILVMQKYYIWAVVLTYVAIHPKIGKRKNVISIEGGVYIFQFQ